MKKTINQLFSHTWLIANLGICRTAPHCRINCREIRRLGFTAKDAAMLLHRLLNMNLELYGEYPEFVEVDMTLKQLVDTGIDEAIDKAVAKVEAKADARVAKAEAKAAIAEKRISRTAKAMKAGGEAMSKIMRYTGLSRREIMAL